MSANNLKLIAMVALLLCWFKVSAQSDLCYQLTGFPGSVSSSNELSYALNSFDTVVVNENGSMDNHVVLSGINGNSVKDKFILIYADQFSLSRLIDTIQNSTIIVYANKLSLGNGTSYILQSLKIINSKLYLYDIEDSWSASTLGGKWYLMDNSEVGIFVDDDLSIASFQGLIGKSGVPINEQVEWNPFDQSVLDIRANDMSMVGYTRFYRRSRSAFNIASQESVIATIRPYASEPWGLNQMNTSFFLSQAIPPTLIGYDYMASNSNVNVSRVLEFIWPEQIAFETVVSAIDIEKLDQLPQNVLLEAGKAAVGYFPDYNVGQDVHVAPFPMHVCGGNYTRVVLDHLQYSFRPNMGCNDGTRDLLLEDSTYLKSQGEQVNYNYICQYCHNIGQPMNWEGGTCPAPPQSLKPMHLTQAESDFLANFESKITLFPNPTAESIFIKTPRVENVQLSVRIYNSIGQTMIEGVYSDYELNNVGININQFTPGDYYISIDNKRIGRFIKE